MKDYRQLGLNPYLKKEGSLPMKPMNVQERPTYIPPDVVFESGGTLKSPAIGTPTISGGNINNATIGTPAITGGTYNNGVFGTPAITGGTINNAVFGTAAFTGGTINNATLGTPAVTGGTYNSGVFGSPTITGGNYNTGTFAGTPVITNPSVTNGTANTLTLGTPAIVGGTASGFTFSNKINVLVGANLSVGKGTLASGVATISTTTVGADSNVFLTPISSGANLGILSIGTINAGTNFVVNSSNVLDSDSFNWWIIN